MLTCNGIPIPEMIPVNRIISAFQNVMDLEKIQRYQEMIRCSNGYFPDSIPAIKGYPDYIIDDDIDVELMFINGEPVTKEHIGELVWYVTDGHHRATSSANEGLPFLNTTMDESTFTKVEELEAWRAVNP